VTRCGGRRQGRQVYKWVRPDWEEEEDKNATGGEESADARERRR
jgi:hypothetical protein